MSTMTDDQLQRAAELLRILGTLINTLPHDNKMRLECIDLADRLEDEINCPRSVQEKAILDFKNLLDMHYCVFGNKPCTKKQMCSVHKLETYELSD